MDSEASVRVLKHSSKGKSRHPPEVRRYMILKSAQRIIIKKGLVSASTLEIAREANVSIGTLSYHFHGIDEILRETLALSLREFWRPIRDKLDKRTTALDGIRTLLDSSFTESGEQLFSLWLDFWARSSHVPEFKQWILERYAWFKRTFGELIDEGVKNGEFYPIEATELARKYTAHENGVLLLWINFGEIDRKTARQMLYSFLASELKLSKI